MATSEPNVPGHQRDLPSSRWETFLQYLLLPAGFFFVVAEFYSVQLEISPNASAQTQGRFISTWAELSFGAAFFLLMTSMLIRRPWWLRTIRKLPLVVLFYVLLLGTTYNELAHNLPEHRLATLEQIAPGPMAVWRAVYGWLELAFIIGLAVWYVTGLWRIRRSRRVRGE